MIILFTSMRLERDCEFIYRKLFTSFVCTSEYLISVRNKVINVKLSCSLMYICNIILYGVVFQCICYNKKVYKYRINSKYSVITLIFISLDWEIKGALFTKIRDINWLKTLQASLIYLMNNLYTLCNNLKLLFEWVYKTSILEIPFYWLLVIH